MKCPQCGSSKVTESVFYAHRYRCFNSNCSLTWFEVEFSSGCDRVGEEVESRYGLVDAIDVT